MHMLKQETKMIQEKLGEYCRSGEYVEIPGVKGSRLHHYRRLVYNVVDGALETAFPITFNILSEDEWEQMVYNFFSEHDCQTPQLWELPLEFYEYAKEENYAGKYNKPYLSDLLYFEWVEIEVHTMPDAKYPELKKDGDLFRDNIILNDESKIIHLSYPVHNRSVKEAENSKGDYFILSYRVPESGQVRFINLSVLYAYVIERIRQENKPVILLIPEIAERFGIEDLDSLKLNVRRFLNNLLEQSAILGFRYLGHLN